MGNINVELSGEDVNRAIADAIVKSVLGDTIVKMTNDYVKGLSHSWENPVKKVIEEEVRRQITKLILARIPEIEAEVQKHLSTEMVNKIVIAAVEKFEKSIH